MFMNGRLSACDSATAAMAGTDEVARLQPDTLVQTILDCMTAQVAVLNRDGVIILVNAAWRRFAEENAPSGGKPLRHGEVGANYLKVCAESHGPDSEGAMDAMQGIRGVLDGRLPVFYLEYPCHSPQQQRWFIMTVTPSGDADGGAVIVHTDITIRKLVEVQQYLASIVFESNEGIVVTDADLVILKVNRAFTRLTGYASEEVIGRKPSMLRSDRHDAKYFRQIRNTLAENHFWQGEIWTRRKNGKTCADYLSISAIEGVAGEVSHYVAVFSDITRVSDSAAQMHRLAYYDTLTELPNRRLMQDRLEQAIVDSRRHRRYGAVLLLDLDAFKVINDTLGHEAGDALLVKMAERIGNCVREGDTVARLGGDEFVVILDNLGGHLEEAALQAARIAEKLNRAIAQPCRQGDSELYPSASIGATLIGQNDSVQDLLKHADLALYRAKDSGRNAVRFYDPAMQVAVQKRSAMDTALRQALNQGQFRLYYQPQVDAAGRMNGVEALLRWQDPQNGLILPNDFIPLAEETGLILPIGRWVLETACAQIRRWECNTPGRALKIAVNISARQFRQPDFVTMVREVLDASGADPRLLKLELTESLVLEDIDDTIEKMHALNLCGVRFSMDDFGTGYSCLSYLAQLPLNQLKIDRSFVCSLPGKRNDEIIARTIIALGCGLGMEVIAEGVESEQQRDFLETHGCRAYPGYLYGRPMPIEALDALLMSVDEDLSPR
jgi:diguanylate cyclase (GGDEF)-like protein/PAS domain S-box-containing protein